MLDSGTVAYILEAPSLTGESTESWVQVAKSGNFRDRRYGTFSITSADFAQWIRNFDSLSPEGLPVDIDHAPEKRGVTEAAGWIVKLEQRGAELWGLVQWNSLGVQLVKDQRYRFLSPSYEVHHRDETGRDHGTALVGVALTNRPFLNMATISLSQEIGDDLFAVELDKLSGQDRKDLPHSDFIFPDKAPGSGSYPIPDVEHGRAALRFASGKPEEEAVKKAVYSRYPELRPKDKNLSVSDSRTRMPLAENIAKALGVEPDADEQVILDAISAMNKEPEVRSLDDLAKDEGKVVLDAGQVNALVADATKGREAAEKLSRMEFETAFNRALDAGKVAPAQKETYEALYGGDSENTLKLLDSLSPVVNVSPEGQGGAPAPRKADAFKLDNMTVDEDSLEVHEKALALSRESNIDYLDAVSEVLAGRA